MFTEADRQALLSELIEHAHADPEVSAAALVGSAARRTTDRWSDIDLTVPLAPEAEPSITADGWQSRLELTHDVVDHLDLWSGPVLSQVFLLVGEADHRSAGSSPPSASWSTFSMRRSQPSITTWRLACSQLSPSSWRQRYPLRTWRNETGPR